MKAVLITGGGRGIGRALATEAVARGYKTHVTVRKAGDEPSGTVAHVLDVREREKMRALLSLLAPEIDYFIANAGIDAPYHPKDAQAADKAAEVFEVNGTATAFSMYFIAGEWVRLGKKGVRLAVVSSQAVGRGIPKSATYIATKSAEKTLAQGLEIALEKHGVGVSVIQPGFVETDMSRKQPVRPWLWSVEKASRFIWDRLERGCFRIRFPAGITMAMLFMNRLPYFIFRGLVRFLHRKGMA